SVISHQLPVDESRALVFGKRTSYSTDQQEMLFFLRKIAFILHFILPFRVGGFSVFLTKPAVLKGFLRVKGAEVGVGKLCLPFEGIISGYRDDVLIVEIIVRAQDQVEKLF